MSKFNFQPVSISTKFRKPDPDPTIFRIQIRAHIKKRLRIRPKHLDPTKIPRTIFKFRINTGSLVRWFLIKRLVRSLGGLCLHLISSGMAIKLPTLISTLAWFYKNPSIIQYQCMYSPCYGGSSSPWPLHSCHPNVAIPKSSTKIPYLFSHLMVYPHLELSCQIHSQSFRDSFSSKCKVFPSLDLSSKC